MNRSRPTFRSARRSRRGATAVEFAIAAPVLLLVTFGAFEVGRLNMIRSMAQDAAYEACRYCMVEGATAAEAEEKAKSVLALVGARGAVVTVNDGENFDRETQEVTVSVEIPMEQNALLMTGFCEDKYIRSTISLNMERYSGFYDSSN